jgi:cardiolipin synthase A/B
MKKKWKWALTAMFVTMIGMLIYANLLPLKKELQFQIEMSDSVRSEHFEKILGQLMGPYFVDGNTVKTLRNGNEIFPAMLKAISLAKKTITFESYIYWSGQIGNLFVEALCDRARHGVKVHVLLDWLGSQKIDPDYIHRMKEAGVEVERYHQPAWYNISRMNNRTHRKILVIDGVVGFTGGVGIADEWNGDGLDPDKWRDTHYEVRGPVVAQMQAAFLDNWMKVRPEVRHSEDYFPKSLPTLLPKRGAVAQMFKSTSREGGSSIHIMYLIAIAAAKKSIFLEGAYFVPDEVTIQELVKAAHRGVRIEIIVPGDLTDTQIVRHASKKSWGRLLEAGVRIYEYKPARFHCKVLVIDDFFVSIGSTNFDERSFKLNDEANLNVLDESLAKDQIAMFEEDRKRSIEITLQEWKERPWADRILEKLVVIGRSQF